MKYSAYAECEIKFVPLYLRSKYFIREAYFILLYNISLVPKERISLKKDTFWCRYYEIRTILLASNKAYGFGT